MSGNPRIPRGPTLGPVRLTARELPVLAEADVVVAGGGPAGLGAALAAARRGASVVLLERYGFLGGNFTAASVGTVCGLYLDTGAGFAPVVGGIAEEFTDRLAADGAGVGSGAVQADRGVRLRALGGEAPRATTS